MSSSSARAPTALAAPKSGHDQLGGDSAADGTGDARLDEIVRYTMVLTRSPAEVTEQDTESVREVGPSDADIVAVNNLAAYFAYRHRHLLSAGDCAPR